MSFILILIEVFCQVFLIIYNVKLLSIVDHARLGVDKIKIDNII